MRLRQLLIVAGLSIFACASAFAETGVGKAPRSSLHDVRDAVSAPRIELDAFRFSQQPSLGGRGYVMRFAGRVEGAWAEIIWLDGHPRSGWRRTRRERFELSASEYRDIATFVDEQLARGEPQLIDDDGEGFVCTDGPGYLTERFVGGTQIWMRGFCGDDHPNQVIKDYLAVWALHRLGR